MSTAELDALASGAHHLLVGKYFQLAAFVMLVYDHMLTFPEEVDRIWKRRFSGASILFLLNRYITPLQFIIIIDAFHDPRWTKHACSDFAIFEGASTVALIAICQLIMILRVYALYGRSAVILTVLMLFWVVQIVTSAVGLRSGTMAELPPMLTGCILTGKGPLLPLVWVGPLVTDTVIFGLTLWRTRMYLLNSGKVPTIHIFVRDGSAYFLAIFMANLLNTLLYFLAESDLKAIGASFSQLLTAVMVSRIVLNLRSQNAWTNPHDTTASSLNGYSGRFTGTGFQATFLTRTISDLAPPDGRACNCTIDNIEGSYLDSDMPMSTMEIRRKLDSITCSV